MLDRREGGGVTFVLVGERGGRGGVAVIYTRDTIYISAVYTFICLFIYRTAFMVLMTSFWEGGDKASTGLYCTKTKTL